MMMLRRLAAVAVALALAASPALADFTIQGPITFDSGIFSHSGARVSGALAGTVPGTYTNANVTVDQYGRVTSVTSGTGSCGLSVALGGVLYGNGSNGCASDATRFHWDTSAHTLKLHSDGSVLPFGNVALDAVGGNENLSGTALFRQSDAPSGAVAVGYSDTNSRGFIDALDASADHVTLALNKGGGPVCVNCFGELFAGQTDYASLLSSTSGGNVWQLAVGRSGGLQGGIYTNANLREQLLFGALGFASVTTKISDDPTEPSLLPGDLKIAGLIACPAGNGVETDGSTGLLICGGPSGGGTVTSVGVSVPATSIFGVTGTPVTTTGTIGITTTGTSGGIPYFSSSTQLSSSSALTANLPVIGGGAGVAPSVGTRSGNTTAFVTTTGSQTNGNLVSIDASGNHIAAGVGIDTSGTSGGVAYYSSSTQVSSSAALTANLPVIGGGAGVAPSVGTRSGNTTAFVTTTGSQTNGNLVSIDASGNHVAAGVTTGTSGHSIPFLDGTNTWSGTQTLGTVIGTVTSQSGTTYTLASTDCGTTVKFTNVGTVAVTAPSSLVSGCHIALMQTTVGGQITVSAGGGATFAANPHGFTKTFGLNAIIGVSYFDTSTFTVLGDGA